MHGTIPSHAAGVLAKSTPHPLFGGYRQRAVTCNFGASQGASQRYAAATSPGSRPYLESRSSIRFTKAAEMYAAAASTLPSITAAKARVRGFTPLEERVLRLAASGSERPSTSVEPSYRRLLRQLGNVVMARRGGRELADPRLEALRSYAASLALGRSDGLPIFYAAGYTPGQAAEAKRFVAAAGRAARAHPHAARDRVVYASGISIGLASLAAFIGMTGTLLAGY